MKKIIIEAIRSLEEKKNDKPDNKENKEKDKEDGRADVEQDRIYRILSNNLFNHAEVAKLLWGKNEATERSLFRKKLNKMSNDSGGTYSFDPEEITKISSILMNASNQVRKELGKHTTD